MATRKIPNIYERKRKLPEFLTPGEFKLLITVGCRHNSPAIGLRNILILRVMYQSGLRVSEVVNLRPQDLSEGSIMVRQGKGQKDRAVPIPADLEKSLREYVSLRGGRGPVPIFRISTRQARNVVYDAIKEAGITKKVSPHILRHSYGRQCVINGLPLNVLQQWMGHAHIGTTYIYVQLAGFLDPELTAKMPLVEV